MESGKADNNEVNTTDAVKKVSEEADTTRVTIVKLAKAQQEMKKGHTNNVNRMQEVRVEETAV